MCCPFLVHCKEDINKCFFFNLQAYSSLQVKQQIRLFEHEVSGLCILCHCICYINPCLLTFFFLAIPNSKGKIKTASPVLHFTLTPDCEVGCFNDFVIDKLILNCHLLDSTTVRSFGTEDRPTDRPLPPRNEIFEFIIFRGHDIKDLHVCEPPKPQPTEGVPLDPAIVKVTWP